MMNRRITVEFANGKKAGETVRKDVAKGEVVHIKGALKKKDLIVIVVKKFIDGRECEAEHATARSNLEVAVVATGGVPAADAKKVKAPPGLSFMVDDKTSALSQVNNWPSCIAFDQSETRFNRLKHRCFVALESVHLTMPKWGKEDLTLVRRNGKFNVEVWTNKDFAARTMMFAPESNDMRDRFFTQANSVLLDGCEQQHPQRKKVIVDGRWRGVINGTEKNNALSLFFTIERGEKPNLTMEYTDVKLQADFTTGYNKRTYSQAFGEGEVCRVPIFFNAKRICKGTKLVAPKDEAVLSLASLIADKRKQKALKEAKDAKDAQDAKNGKK